MLRNSSIKWIKRFTLAWLFLAFIGFVRSPILVQAQSTLSAGDIAIIGMNADDPDEFAFVLLTNITSGTTINFTDNGWFSSNSFRAGEGTLTWTASSDICAGTVVSPAVSGMLFAAAGDQILAYQGTSASPTFIYALNNEGAGVWQADATSSNTSALPTGLSNGTTAFALNEIDNAVYTGTTSGTKAALLTAIATAANWTTNDSTRQTMPSSNFTVTDAAACVTDAPPTVSSTSPADNDTGVATSPVISINFSENVTATAGWFTVICDAVDVTADFTESGGPSSYTLTYSGTAFAGSENCVVTLSAANITDSATQQLDGNSDGTEGDDYSFDFTIVAPPSITLIHDIQGNGASVTGAGPFTVEAIVTGDFQASNELRGFFIQEEDADADADPSTSEGIFVYCNACPTAVAVGDKVQVTGSASENFNQSQLSATAAGTISIISTGNTLPSVTTLDITSNLVSPAADKDTFYEAYEGMLVSISDTLSIAEYFELFRFGEIVLYQGGRPYQYTHVDNSPTAGEYTSYNDDLTRRRIVLDDGSNTQNRPISISPQQLFYPYPNGFSAGTQGTDYFRGGDTISGLTGILGYGFSEWRLQPSQSSYTFNVANPRPSLPSVGGNITVASFNVLNYFTTIDTTSSNNSGPCAPSGTEDCRGADSAAELVAQTDKLVQALATIDADIFGLIEIENNSVTLASLVNSLNAVVGAGTYDYVNTGSIGTDAIMVAIIYKTAVVEPVAGELFIDTDAVNNRPTLAQNFRVIDLTNLDYSGEFTVVVNHFKSKGSACGAGDDDTTTGQGNCNGTRVAQANRLLTWINGTIIPATGESDILIIGDLNSYRGEDPITTLTSGGYTNLVDSFVGANAYSYVFDGMIGYLDHALGSVSMTAQVVGVADWHINADEVPVFDYNDAIRDTGEASFEEEPDGNPLYEVNAYRTSDHDPVLVGIDLDVTPPLAVQVKIAGSIAGVINSNNVRTIQVLFDKAVNEAGLEDSVTNPDNFVLFYEGANGVLETNTSPFPASFCAAGANALGDDVKITTNGIVYNSTNYQANVRVNNNNPLGQGDYLLVICGSTSIVDLSGTPLDGNGDGIGGDDFATSFTIVTSTGGTTGTAGGGSTGTGGTGVIVAGGIDYDGDGIADVTQLPSTGETPLWANWVLWIGALLLLSSFSLLLLGSKKQN